MCAYLGLRRDEACQLRVRHVVQVAGIWAIDLNAPDLRLKEGAGSESERSRRWVPLNRDLLRLGFLESLVSSRSASDQLFPELDAGNAHAAFGVSLGKRFGHYQRSQHPDLPHGLHRFRHTFSTVLENTEAKSAFIDELTGHSSDQRRSERARYTKSIWIANLKTTIAQYPGRRR